MKKGIRFTILTILLTAAVILLPMVQASLTQPRQPSSSETEASQLNTEPKPEQKDPAQTETPSASKDETVLYFAVLKEPSAIDTFLSAKKAYPDVRTFLLSADGKACGDAIKRSQAVAKASVAKLIPSSDFTAGRSYAALWNALTFQAPQSAADKIARINGIEKVYVLQNEWLCLAPEESAVTADESNETEPLTEADEPNTEEVSPHYAQAQPLLESYRQQIGADSDITADFSGEGTLIAILDSEFETDDPVFAASPAVTVLTQDSLNTLSQHIRLNIGDTLSVANCYVSPKIVYAYDYANNDNQTADRSLYHGTLTAAVAAGHNNEEGVNAYRGVAAEAQLALMKIASHRTEKGRILIETDALLAALDDAVKLGADAVNLGFGQEAVSDNLSLYQTAFSKMQQAGIALMAAAGNSGYNGQALAQELTAEDIFYSTENVLSALEGVTAVGSVQNPLHVRRFITIDDTKLYYHGLSDTPLTDILHYEEPPETPEVSDSESAEPETDESSLASSAEEPAVSAVSALEEEPSDSLEPLDEPPLRQHNEYIYIDRFDSTTVLHSEDIENRLLILRISQAEDGAAAIQEAVEKGAAAVALTEAASIDIQPLYGLPFLVLEGDHTAYLQEHPTGLYEINLNDELTASTAAAQVSAFTSYGDGTCSSSVTRLMAPGEEVYAAVKDNGRAFGSGTSAAVPAVTGAYAVMKQYVSSVYVSEETPAAEKMHLAESLLMSTAAPLTVPSSSDTVLYASPRVQGFGLLQLDKAMQAHAYLSADAQKLTAISLGDSPTGEYSFQFTVHNLTDKPHAYKLSFVLQTDTPQNGLNTRQPRSLTEEAVIDFLVGDTSVQRLTVSYLDSTEITVNLSLQPAMLTTLQEQFPQGCYLDGYVFLTSLNGQEQLCLPFTGFYGSLAETSPLDNTLFDTEEPLSGLDNGLVAAAYQDENYQAVSLLQQDNTLLYAKDAIRTVTDDSHYESAFVLPDIYPLRDLYDFTISVYDQNDSPLFSENLGYVSAYREKDRRPYEKLMPKAASLRNAFLQLNSGEYRYEIAARTRLADGTLSELFTRSYTLIQDTDKPVVLSSQTEQQNGRTILSLTASDTNGLQGFRLYAAAYDSRKDTYDSLDSLDSMMQAGYLPQEAYELIDRQTNEDGSQTFRYDVTNLSAALRKYTANADSTASPCSDSRIVVKAIDNAYQASAANIADVIEFGSAAFHFTDQDGHPAPHISITIGKVTITSDNSGYACFEHLAPNYYHAILHCDTGEYILPSSSLLVALTASHLAFNHEQVVTALQPYSPAPSSSPSDTSSGPSLPEDTSTSDPLFSFFFIGTFLTICIILFLFRKTRS